MSMPTRCHCLHLITYLSHNHHTMHKQKRSTPPQAPTHTHIPLPMWVTLADFQSLLCASLVLEILLYSYLHGPSHHVETFSSQALSDKELNIPRKNFVKSISEIWLRDAVYVLFSLNQIKHFIIRCNGICRKNALGPLIYVHTAWFFLF